MFNWKITVSAVLNEALERWCALQSGERWGNFRIRIKQLWIDLCAALYINMILLLLGYSPTAACSWLIGPTMCTMYWKQQVVIMSSLSSLVAPRVVVTTFYDVTNDDKVGIITTSGFQWSCDQSYFLPWNMYSIWLWHVFLITVTLEWAPWRLGSPVSRLFTQPFIQAPIKENTKTTRHWPLWGESTGDRWIAFTKDQQRGNASIWWRHHGYVFVICRTIISPGTSGTVMRDTVKVDL